MKKLSLYDSVPSGIWRGTQFAIDAIVVSAAFLLAYSVSVDYSAYRHDWNVPLHQLPAVFAIQMSTLVLCRAHRILWRYVSVTDLYPFVNACLLAAVPLILTTAAGSIVPAAYHIPVTVVVIYSVLMLFGTLGVRLLRRTLYEQSQRSGSRPHRREKKRVLLIGAGQAGIAAVTEIRRENASDLEIAGFVDDDPRKQGGLVGGLKVFGGTVDLKRLVPELQIDHVIVTIAQASRDTIRHVMGVCESIPVKALAIPTLHDLVHGSVTVNRFREIDIADLLGRPPVNLDVSGRRSFIAGKTVMITGAGGSIGSELARQVARLAPASLLLVERAEYALYTIHSELTRTCPGVRLQPVLADITCGARMQQVFAQYRPAIILHAAAHKHVPMIEDNPIECVTNNIFGTRCVGELAGEFGAEAFVLISTDKAVNPTSLMGASKRVTELIGQSLNGSYSTRYVAVRFGNVIGSAGSVIPKFREQIRQGGPVTVTHPEMVRYFMTIPEAAELVLEAASMGEGGEIFVLDMGEPVKIVTLAEDLITLSGYRPYEDIDIVFSGIRPGEKLYEELQCAQERLDKTRHPKIFSGRVTGVSVEELRNALQLLEDLAVQGHAGAELRSILARLIPDASLDVAEAEAAKGRAAVAGVAGV